MAKDVKTNADTSSANAVPKKSSKKVLIILSVLFVLILGVGSIGAYWLFSTGNPDDDEDVVQEARKPAKKKNKESIPVYITLDAFTVNLIPEHTDQFLQLVLSIEVEDVAAGDQLKMYTPKIRNNVMLLLSSKKASELLTKEGKETLALEIRDLINEVLSPSHRDDGPVRDVLFTSFIIQ